MSTDFNSTTISIAKNFQNPASQQPVKIIAPFASQTKSFTLPLDKSVSGFRHQPYRATPKMPSDSDSDDFPYSRGTSRSSDDGSSGSSNSGRRHHHHHQQMQPRPQQYHGQPQQLQQQQQPQPQPQQQHRRQPSFSDFSGSHSFVVTSLVASATPAGPAAAASVPPPPPPPPYVAAAAPATLPPPLVALPALPPPPPPAYAHAPAPQAAKAPQGALHQHQHQHARVVRHNPYSFAGGSSNTSPVGPSSPAQAGAPPAAAAQQLINSGASSDHQQSSQPQQQPQPRAVAFGISHQPLVGACRFVAWPTQLRSPDAFGGVSVSVAAVPVAVAPPPPPPRRQSPNGQQQQPCLVVDQVKFELSAAQLRWLICELAGVVALDVLPTDRGAFAVYFASEADMTAAQALHRGLLFDQHGVWAPATPAERQTVTRYMATREFRQRGQRLPRELMAMSPITKPRRSSK